MGPSKVSATKTLLPFWCKRSNMEGQVLVHAVRQLRWECLPIHHHPEIGPQLSYTIEDPHTATTIPIFSTIEAY